MEIMVVDDDPFVRELIAEEFADAGFCVAEAASAEVALEAMVADVLLPSAVVTDINLGAGMDGIALAGEVRRQWPLVCLVLVSGDTGNFERLPDGACERTLVKPFDPRRLVADVQMILSRRMTPISPAE